MKLHFIGLFHKGFNDILLFVLKVFLAFISDSVFLIICIFLKTTSCRVKMSVVKVSAWFYIFFIIVNIFFKYLFCFLTNNRFYFVKVGLNSRVIFICCVVVDLFCSFCEKFKKSEDFASLFCSNIKFTLHKVCYRSSYNHAKQRVTYRFNYKENMWIIFNKWTLHFSPQLNLIHGLYSYLVVYSRYSRFSRGAV